MNHYEFNQVRLLVRMNVSYDGYIICEMCASEPKSAQEYLARWHANYKITGFGLGNVWIHSPCPFCAAPEFMVFELLETDQALKVGGQCKECLRSMKGVFVVNTSHAKQVEFVQTGGPDQPEWLVPQMRRVA